MPKDTLRYYDKIGIFSPKRGDNLYRKYSKNDLIDLMNIQIMRYANISLEEIKGKINLKNIENADSTYREEMAVFFDAKYKETQEKINHLEKICQLLALAADTSRNFSDKKDQQLKLLARQLYKEIQNDE